ncbi:hypothetical protein OS493_019989 [Desmophyllum pertusum]|uniref:Uncharacterized protein n=1 Tax=Desmophyllum pertusum TaxID=174260 RepID=A0A9W9YBB7_9CNID|nr:hypothetical protein OS493_019989 [Desmophyllum pertusum]
MADGLAEGDQQKLAVIVKGLHSRLRKQLREANGDHHKVWENHCSDKKILRFVQLQYLLQSTKDYYFLMLEVVLIRFATYEDIYPVAIDLQPAESMVYECDFLNLEIQDLPHSQQGLCPCDKTKRKCPVLQSSSSKEHSNLDDMCIKSLEKGNLAQQEALQLHFNIMN